MGVSLHNANLPGPQFEVSLPVPVAPPVNRGDFDLSSVFAGYFDPDAVLAEEMSEKDGGVTDTEDDDTASESGGSDSEGDSSPDREDEPWESALYAAPPFVLPHGPIKPLVVTDLSNSVRRSR